MLENRWCIFICVQRKLPLFMRKDQHNYDHIWPRPRWDTVSKNFCTLSANESCQQSTGGKSCTSNGWDWKSMSKVKRPTNVSCHYWHEYTLQLENLWAFNPLTNHTFWNFGHNNRCFHRFSGIQPPSITPTTSIQDKKVILSTHQTWPFRVKKVHTTLCYSKIWLIERQYIRLLC